MLDQLRKFFGFNDDKTNRDPTKNDFAKGLMGVAASGLAGAGAAYSNAKKLKQDKELQQQTNDTNRLLAESKVNLEKQRMANQNFSGYNIGKPKTPGLLNYTPARVSPINRVPA